MKPIDTNILAYLLIQGDRTDDCQALYRMDPDWRSDAFVLVELSNVLATYVRAGHLLERDAIDLMGQAEEILRPGLETVPHVTALRLAREFDVSAYDARFLAVARRLGTRLVTEDARLRRAAPDLTRSLSDALSGRG